MAVVLVRCRLSGSGIGRFATTQSTKCLHIYRQLSTLHSVRCQNLLRINRQVYNVQKVKKPDGTAWQLISTLYFIWWCYLLDLEAGTGSVQRSNSYNGTDRLSKKCVLSTRVATTVFFWGLSFHPVTTKGRHIISFSFMVIVITKHDTSRFDFDDEMRAGSSCKMCKSLCTECKFL